MSHVLVEFYILTLQSCIPGFLNNFCMLRLASVFPFSSYPYWVSESGTGCLIQAIEICFLFLLSAWVCIRLIFFFTKCLADFPGKEIDLYSPSPEAPEQNSGILLSILTLAGALEAAWVLCSFLYFSKVRLLLRLWPDSSPQFCQYFNVLMYSFNIFVFVCLQV